MWNVKKLLSIFHTILFNINYFMEFDVNNKTNQCLHFFCKYKLKQKIFSTNKQT